MKRKIHGKKPFAARNQNMNKNNMDDSLFFIRWNLFVYHTLYSLNEVVLCAAIPIFLR